MTYCGCNPVLLVEGDGDKEAVPFLLRRLFPEISHGGCVPAPRPIMCGEIARLRGDGVLERFVTYACRRTDGDSVLLVIDCDDDCPRQVVDEFVPRVEPIAVRFEKKVGIGFLKCEFETMFLYSLGELAEQYPDFDWEVDEEDLAREWSEVRGAKGELNRRMRAHHYKETRDQTRFVHPLNLQELRGRDRSIEHLFRLLNWLTDEESTAWVYPAA